ncbi:MAG: photosynthetic complex assembly protein PuhC [Pseudomonadota bacterium]
MSSRPIAKKGQDPFLFVIGLFLAIVLVFVGFSSVTGIGVAHLDNEPHVDRIEVRFADEWDGGVGVYDPKTGEAIHIFGPGQGGFVRVALRALAAERRLAGVGKMPPFELQMSATGHVVLFDPTTNKSLTLSAFGEQNEGVFAQLFAMQTEREMP